MEDQTPINPQPVPEEPTFFKKNIFIILGLATALGLITAAYFLSVRSNEAVGPVSEDASSEREQQEQHLNSNFYAPEGPDDAEVVMPAFTTITKAEYDKYATSLPQDPKYIEKCQSECKNNYDEEAIRLKQTTAVERYDLLCLRIKLTNGTSKDLCEDKPYEDIFAPNYYFVKHFKGVGFLFAETSNHYMYGLFVDENTGQELRLYEYPVISSDGKRIASSHFHVWGGGESVNFVVWEKQEDVWVRSIKIEGNYTNKTYREGIINPIWKDSKTLYMVKRKMIFGPYDDKTGRTDDEIVDEYVSYQFE